MTLLSSPLSPALHPPDTSPSSLGSGAPKDPVRGQVVRCAQVRPLCAVKMPAAGSPLQASWLFT